MSQIEDLGGMTAGDIKHLMLQSATTIKEGFEKDLGPIRENVTALVGTDNLEGMVPRYTSMLEKFIEKQETWHEEDLEFRSSTHDRLERVERHQRHMKDQLTLLSWIIRLTSGAVKITSALVAGEEPKSRGRSLAKTTTIGVGWIALWQFIHTVFPTVRTWLHHFSW